MTFTPASVKKSHAPLFLTFSADPNYDDPDVVPSTANAISDVLSYVPSYKEFWGFEKGDVICELVPLGFFYKDESGKVVNGDVKPEDLVNMLKMQAAIYEGEIEPVPSEISGGADLAPDARENNEYTSAREWGGYEDDMKIVGLAHVEDVLVYDKGYDESDYYVTAMGDIILEGYGVVASPIYVTPVGKPLYDLDEIVYAVPHKWEAYC